MSAPTKAFILFLALILGITLFLVARGDEEGSPLTELPSTLHGEWLTMDPLFVDRALILEADSFTMDLGEHGQKQHAIEKLLSYEDTDSVWYAVRYFDDGEEEEIHFRYLPAYDEIRIRNRDTVWWKRRAVIEKARADEAAEKKRKARSESARKRRRG